MRDNQNRDLEAFRSRLERDVAARKRGEEDSHRLYEEAVAACPLPDWTTVEGILCLRSGDSNYVAVPLNDAKTPARGNRSALFDVISLSPRELVVQLRNTEVRNWLWRKHQAEKGL